MRHSNFLFFNDIENSGPCPINNGIIDFCMYVTDLNHEVVDTFRYKVRPPHLNEYNWSKNAEKYHKISYDEVLTYPSNREFCYEFLLWIKKYKDEYNFPLPFVCHASPSRFWSKEDQDWVMPWLDYYFLQWAMAKEGWEYSLFKVFNHSNLISTVKMAREMGFGNNRLDEWAKRLGIRNFGHHDCEQDTIATIELHKYLTGLRMENEAFKSKKTRKTKNGNKDNLSLQF